MTLDSTVYIVDDDPAVRRSLQWLIESIGLNVRSFDGARGFLDAGEPERPGCLILDVRMPEMSGLELQDELISRGTDIPIIIVTAHADVPMAVRAMGAGAVHFVEKPFNDQDLLDHVQHAIEGDKRIHHSCGEVVDIRARINTLSDREREVLQCVVDGLPNKAIALHLGLSDKTVESHRAKMMRKMKANSVAQLVRLVLTEAWARENPVKNQGNP